MCALSAPVLAAEDDDLHKLEHDASEVSSRAIYEAAGIRFNGSGSSWSTIGGYSTSSMTWSGTGGIMLYNAFTNLDNAIATVDAKVASAVTTSTLDEVFQKYFATGGGENMWYFSKWILSNTSSANASLQSLVSAVNAVGNRLQPSKGSGGIIWDPSFKKADGTSAIVGDLLTASKYINDLIYDTSLLTRNTINSAISTTNGYIGSLGQIYDATGGYTGYGSLQASLGALSKLIYNTSTTGNSLGSYLSVDGRLSSAAYLTSPQLLRTGLVGLSYNLAGSDKATTFSLLVPNEGEDGGMREDEKQVDNLLDALGLLGTSLQNPLAKLAYVWADDDDIRIADKNQPVKDAIEDNFVGDGDAAVKPSDIGDLASFGSDLKDAFSGAGSPSDIFSLFGDSNVSWFFSQEVADDLDQVNSPVLASDDDPIERYLSGVDVDEDGFVHPKSSPFWDVSLYQG